MTDVRTQIGAPRRTTRTTRHHKGVRASEREGGAARDGLCAALRDTVPACEASPAVIAGSTIARGTSSLARERSKKSKGESVALLEPWFANKWDSTTYLREFIAALVRSSAALFEFTVARDGSKKYSGRFTVVRER